MMEVLKRKIRNLDEIYENFQQQRIEYTHDAYLGSGDHSERDRLLKYNDVFTGLFEDIRPLCAEVYVNRTLHDDKACSAYKARVARKLREGDPKMSWNKATEMAAATDEYKDFLQQRAYYYESWDSVSHLRDSIKQYIIAIGQRLSK